MVLLINVIALLVAFRLLFEPKIIGSLMKRRWNNLIMLQHALFFVVYTVALIIIMSYFTEMPFVLYRILFIMVLNTSLYIFCYSHLVPAYYQTNKYPEYILFALILFISSSLLRLLAEPVLGEGNRVAHQEGLYLMSIYASQSIVVLVASFLGISRHKFLIEFDYKNLQSSKDEIDLNLMKSKINPHFLLNTLNNIYADSYNPGPSTTEAILQLSQLLQYVIYETDKRSITVLKEIEMIKALAGLYQLKYNSSLDIEFRLNDMDVQEQAEIPPSVYFTLFENALKHSGIGREEEAYILVEFERTCDEIVFKISNSVPLSSRETVSHTYKGMGMSSLRKILHVEYAENHQLVEESLNKTYISTLKIKL